MGGGIQRQWDPAASIGQPVDEADEAESEDSPVIALEPPSDQDDVEYVDTSGDER